LNLSTAALCALWLPAAAKRGISAVLEEAIESYLQGEVERGKRTQTFLALAGTFSATEAEELLHTARILRESWR
jgi:hypothetical protein